MSKEFYMPETKWSIYETDKSLESIATNNSPVSSKKKKKKVIKYHLKVRYKMYPKAEHYYFKNWRKIKEFLDDDKVLFVSVEKIVKEK